MLRSLLVAVFAVVLTACSSVPNSTSLSKALLPTSDVQTQGWQSFNEAKAAIESIKPNETTKEDLKKMGIGGDNDGTITLLSHVDISMRFPAAGFENAKIDKGIHDCIQAGKRCTGYLITVEKTNRERVGDYFLDVARFKQVTETKGWSFNAYVFFVDDVVVYVVYGGQPKIFRTETNRNPLGPIQNFGDWAAGKLR